MRSALGGLSRTEIADLYKMGISGFERKEGCYQYIRRIVNIVNNFTT